jgi:hypothetical protein
MAQLRLPGGGDLPDINLPGLEDLLFKKEKPLTTRLEDAWQGVPHLDGWAPFQPTVLTNGNRNAEGIWNVQPGAYSIELKSFCLRGYTYGPSPGMGYAIGPWKGPHAEILQNVIRRWSLTDIPQQQAQALLWSLLARTKPSKLNRELKVVAGVLLKPEEIATLEGFSLDGLSNRVVGQLTRNVSRELRPLYEAENKIRRMATQANHSYRDMQRLMVLEAPANLPTTLPRGRWLWDPKGYFFRVRIGGYSRTFFEAVVPRKPLINRDSLGRITRLECPPGVVSEVVYDDAEPAKPFPQDPGLTVYPIKGVKLSMPDPENPTVNLTFEKEVSGFIFKGIPKPKPKSDRQALVLRVLSPYGASPLVFQNWGRRYEQAQDAYDRYNTYRDYADRAGRIQDGTASPDAFLDPSHYREGLWEALTGGGLGWLADHYSRQAEAVAYATQQIDQLGRDTPVDPSGGIFTPGNRGSQLIGGSRASF